MKRILLLNNGQFPNLFNSISITLPYGASKRVYVENKIIAALNKYNPKLKVDEIQYACIEKQFSNYKKGTSNGVLVEEFEISPNLVKKQENDGNYIYYQNSKYICRRIMLYIFVSGIEENTRTAFISQTVFPTLLDYVAEYIDSPSYTIANHKFCFINILTKELSSKMILRHLSSLYAADIMDYVEVFETDSLDITNIPSNLKKFLEIFASDFEKKYNNGIYKDNDYIMDFGNKKMIWSTTQLIANKIEHKTTGLVDFKGSSEKFYWMEVLPMTVFAYNQGFNIDYNEYFNFIKTYESKFPSTSKKFARCKTLLKYVEKYCI